MSNAKKLFKPQASFLPSHLSKVLAPLGRRQGGQPGTFASVNVVSPQLCGTFYSSHAFRRGKSLC